MTMMGIAAFVPSLAEASLLVFPNKVITVEAGKTFTLPIAIDPKNEKQYTVRSTLTFSPDLLEIVSFTFESNWLALPQPGYDLINNKTGELIKTAGFPRGFSSQAPFGTVTFRAKNMGKSRIVVGPRSFILNTANKNTLESRPQTLVTVTKTGGTIQPEEPLPNLPHGEENLFDVSLMPHIETSGAGLVSKVAPGEFLPISVKLLNFGNRKKVDVTAMYSITDAQGTVIYYAKETVAVETTATFVKTIQIPFGTAPGIYTAKTSITYEDQLVPATTEFPFTVERKILGLFQSDFLLYGGITCIISALAAMLGYALIQRRRRGRFSPFDYSDIPRDKRIFYEILSDTIMEMRQRVGDDALNLALHIDGLKIDKETGRVISLTAPPAKIIATLVSEYEKTLGKKVSFSLRKEKADL